MSAADIGTIERVRRMMPRNQDVMDVCAMAEAGIVAHAAALSSSKCAICAERREKNAAATKAARKAKKA